MSQNSIAVQVKRKGIRYFAVDFLIVVLIYLLPTLSHLTSIPLYLLEPMRLALIFCIITTNRTNSIIIALTLPVFSFLITSHPELLKSGLIASDLIINTILFYFLSSRIKNVFLVMMLSIATSKVFYYSGKFLLLNFGLIESNLISTPLWIQFTLLIFLSAVSAILIKKDAVKPASP